MLADRLGMSLQRCMRETTSTEFLEWQKYFEQDLALPKREDFYLAQVAAEVRRTIARTPTRVRTEHFLLELTTKGKKAAPLTEDGMEKRVADSKAKWFAFTNLKARRPPPQRTRTDGDDSKRT